MLCAIAVKRSLAKQSPAINYAILSSQAATRRVAIGVLDPLYAAASVTHAQVHPSDALHCTNNTRKVHKVSGSHSNTTSHCLLEVAMQQVCMSVICKP